jgi:hypothetical protein
MEYNCILVFEFTIQNEVPGLLYSRKVIRKISKKIIQDLNPKSLSVPFLNIWACFNVVGSTWSSDKF